MLKRRKTKPGSVAWPRSWGSYCHWVHFLGKYARAQEGYPALDWQHLVRQTGSISHIPKHSPTSHTFMSPQYAAPGLEGSLPSDYSSFKTGSIIFPKCFWTQTSSWVAGPLLVYVLHTPLYNTVMKKYVFPMIVLIISAPPEQHRAWYIMLF